MEFFPATRPSILHAVLGEDAERRQRAFDLLISAYWRPVYKHVRLKWRASADDSADLVQGFFASVIERGTLASYDAGQGRFHVWLRTCLDRFVSNERTAAGRLKRGGDFVLESLDYPAAEAELQVADAKSVEPEALFYQEWVRSFFGLAVTRLEAEWRAKGREPQFAMWRRYDMAGDATLSYADLAREYGTNPATVTNQLAAVRRRFRQVLLETLREVTADEREFRNEARSLLGVEVDAPVA